MAVTQLKDGRWICYYRVSDQKGKSRIKKEYFGRGSGAEKAAKKRHSELNLKKRRPPQVTPWPTFGDLALEYVANKNFSENSQKHLLTRLQANLLPAFKDIAAIRISDDSLDRYIKKRRRQGVKYTTICRELADIKAILNWSRSRRPPLIRTNPVAGYKNPRRDDAIIAPPTMKETSRIINAASPHLIRAIKLSYYLGLRPGAIELLSLLWRNVNWESKTILVISAKKGGPRSRLVPIHSKFLATLKEWHAQDNNSKHLIHYSGLPIKSIKTAWKGALKRAKITRRIRPYDLRHHFVTQALEQGADIKALSEIVGSRPETLMTHYQHVTSELHRKTIAKILPLKY